MVDVSITIPMYDECENLKKLISQYCRKSSRVRLRMIVADNSSPDSTVATARELANDFPVRVIERQRKLGLSSAVERI